MEEIHQMKADKMKEKESQYDLKHVVDKEETSVRGRPQKAEQRFITRAKVTALLE